MAKKRRTLKAEVVDEAGNVNLTGTTRLEFALNKGDIIDYYCAEEEEKLEAEIDVVARELSVLDEEIAVLRKKAVGATDENLKDEGWDDYERRVVRCPPLIEAALMKEHKKAIDATKRALIAANKAIQKAEKAGDAFAQIGAEDPDVDEEGGVGRTPVQIETHINMMNNTVEERRWGDSTFPWAERSNARKPLKGSRRQLGKNVPESKLHDLPIGYEFWKQYTSTFSTRTHMTCQIELRIRSEGDNHHNNRLTRMRFRRHSGLIKVPIEGAYKEAVDAYVEAVNSRGKLMKRLHDLLVKHAELPQLKKAVKKQVVGRVLQNTDEGKLLLTALKGVRKAGAKLLTTAVEAEAKS